MSTRVEAIAEALQRVSVSQVLLGALVVLTEGLLLLTYATQPNTRVTNPWPMVYPLVWIDVSVLVLARLWTEPSVNAGTRRRWLAGLLSIGYLLVLGHFGGLYGWFGVGRGLTLDFQLPPGASPALLYDGSPLVLVLQPYKVLGYVTLTALVYRTILNAAGSAVSGVIGLFSCVSCSFPIIALVATTLFGGASAVAAVALTHDYLLSTAIFLTSVGLLYWQPSFGWNPLRPEKLA